MSSLKFTDCKVYAAGYDYSGQLNQASLDSACDVLDETTFGQTTRINKGGLLRVNAAVAGLWDSSAATAPDPVIQAQVGTSDLPIVMVPQGATVGNIAYMFRALRVNYQQMGQVGDLLKFTTKLEGSGGQPLVRGKLMHAGSASGNVTGTAIQLGAVGASAFLYAALEVFSGSGSFVVKVQSDDNSGFTTPTDRITFTTVATGTAITSEWATRVAGSITDDWWRITATNPVTRNFAVAVGIL